MTAMDDQVEAHALEGPRPARTEERDAIIEMVNIVFRVSRGREPTIGSDWPHVYEPSNLENVLVVTDQGRMVASTAVWASEVMSGSARIRVGGINCVGTLFEYRRHGLGAQLMAAAQQKMRELGCHVGVLDTGITNWYRRMGWERAGVMYSYHFDRGNIGLLPKLPLPLRARLAGEEAIADVVRLHNLQATGATRTEEKFRQLIQAKKMPQIYVAESEGVPSAYLLLEDHLIWESAGPAEIVAGLVRSCFEMLDDPSASTSQRNDAYAPATFQTLILSTPGWQHPLVTLLDPMRIPFNTNYLGMLYMMDAQGILDAYGHSSIRVEAKGNEYLLRYKESSVQLNQNQITKLFFGPERVSHFADEIFPLPFWQSEIEKV
jgi:GNAT superfamily N-acetyltransferase